MIFVFRWRWGRLFELFRELGVFGRESLDLKFLLVWGCCEIGSSRGFLF